MTIPLRRFNREAMNTTFEAIIADERDEYCRQAANAVFLEIERLEKILSKFDPGSDIAQLNRLQPGQWLPVAIEVIECLEIASQTYLATNGAFDVAFDSRAKGADRSAMEWLLLTHPETNPKSIIKGMEDPAPLLAGIDPAAASHAFNGAHINLGGIGKGYALDKCVAILHDWGLHNFLLNSGTSTVLARGPGPDTDSDPHEQGWIVGIGGNYKREAGISEITLRDEALSGSGIDVKGEHIRVPGTDHTATAHTCTWVKAKSAARSDALSTAFMVMPNSQIEEFINQNNNISTLTIQITPAGPEINRWGKL